MAEPGPALLYGKVCVVTGANSGIGLEAARGLARLGARVVLACRSRARGEQAAEELAGDAGAGGGALEVGDLDLARMRSVRAFAAGVARDHPAVHVLVNNAGIYMARREVTEDGFERTLAVNHLGPFLLTNLLLPQLRAAAPGARVVNVASAVERAGRLHLDDLQLARRWNGTTAYMQSKLCNVMFTYALARRLEGTGVAANAMHPGSVATNWARHTGGPMAWVVKLATPFMLTPAQGADTAVWLASAPEVEGVTGQYFARRAPLRSQSASYDRALQERLWEASARLTGLDPEAPAGTAAKAAT